MSTAPAKPLLRHVNSINDLKNAEIEQIFALADEYLMTLGDPDVAHRISRTHTAGAGKILASLFHEPSTRTRLSFESSMLRLGGSTVTSADPATSSAAKGESLADTVRVVSAYADVIVLRHPRDGAAKLAAEFADIPVINGGDGSHEHPTQTLCDLYTLRRENKSLKGLNVAISGDLKGSRTIHSFVYALARFGANLILMPARGMELPNHVDARLREEFNCVMAPKSSHGDEAIGALYVTPEEPHQLSLIPNVDLDLSITISSRVDVVYVTRFQKERWTEASHAYPKVDANFLSAGKYKNTSVLHPLPRVGELDVGLDGDKRAVYFRQAAYGVPVRMALISLMLGLQPGKALQRHHGGFADEERERYEQPRDVGLNCANANCIVHEPMEAQYTRNKFVFIAKPTRKLRCAYCDTDHTDFVVASKRTRRFWHVDEKPGLSAGELKNRIIFHDAAQAEAAGYSPAEAGDRRRSAS